MDDKRLNQVLDIEKQAQEIYDSALAEASHIPLQAEKDAQDLLEKTRLEAEAGARKMIADAQTKDESQRILAEAAEKIQHDEILARSNFSRAVSFVIDRLTGKE